MLSDVLLTWSAKIISMVIGAVILMTALRRVQKAPLLASTAAMVGCGIIVLSWRSWQVASIVLVMTMSVPVVIESLLAARQVRHPAFHEHPTPKVR